MNLRVEILAPAGSMESMKAAINAGADAVYMGGSRFGARAYADNPEEDRFLEAIDYAHLHGCRLYMTVNTLVKEAELSQLYDFLKPCYERGLDGVIVQDMGVFAFVREHFPDLHIHASTQMTVTGWRSAKLLKELGAVRVVTARELSLEEIKEIHSHVDIEIESFVHGALCYCYSGQCLLSSLIGGRSGNRGRCAQPCRLPYDVMGQGKDSREKDGQAKGKKAGAEERYVLSLKDLCTLDILPDIIEAGVYSLKIEGRMKSPRYTAGVVSIYRKYVDRYLESGRKGYRVDAADKKMLLELFDRGGFTEGYYGRRNGRDMVALREKPAFREGNQALFDRLDAEFVDLKKQEPVRGRVIVREGQPMRLELETGDGRAAVSVEGAEAQVALNQPLTDEKLLKQMNRTGGAPFYFEELTAELSGSCFVPVQALNELRRLGMEKLEQAILEPRRRKALPQTAGADVQREGTSAPEAAAARKAGQKEGNLPADAACKEQRTPRIHVSLEEPECLSAAADHPDVDEIYLDCAGFEAGTWAEAAARCHKAGKQCALLLPHIFRKDAEQYLSGHLKELKNAGFDEMVLRSMEEIGFLRDAGLEAVPQVFDSNLYTMNHLAAGQMQGMGASRLTLPLELNSRELEELEAGCRADGGAERWELMAYGYLPAMISAQCIVRTTKGCTHKPEVLMVKDRTGKELPVKNCCRFCYNTVYNPSPLSLMGQERMISRLDPAALRLSFTIESPQQMKKVLDACVDHFRYGKDTPAPFADFTRGHAKRGVE